MGLVLHGTTGVTLADGSQSFKLTAKGMVHVDEEMKIGVVIMEPNSTDLLLGMAFLRQFNRALYVSSLGVLLTGEEWLNANAGKAATASASQPPDAQPPDGDSGVVN